MTQTAFEDLFIFEIANNHQGDPNHGHRIIEEVAGIAQRYAIKAAVKFQYRDLPTFIHPDCRQRADIPHIQRFLETELSERDFATLVQTARDYRLITMVTPFDELSVDRILDHGVDVIKIASCSATDWPLLERVAEARKPVICSTGGRYLQEIDKVVSFLTHRDVEFGLLHCVALYPTPPASTNLSFMERMKKRYPGIPVGYSGHEEPCNTDVVKTAVAKGAAILERHFGIETETIKLNKYSLNPVQAATWVDSALTVRAICGPTHSERIVSEAERASLLSLARGTYAKKNICKGESLGRGDVFFAMPCLPGQTSSGEYQDTMVASQDYVAHAAIHERRSADVVSLTRSVIHEAKGLLYEANIEIGRDYTIELSHHYGLERFRNTGAVIVNVVNREYCKKLIIMLPSQSHPIHHHKLKEETFQVLWGELNVEMEGKRLQLRRGDKLLVERLAKHGFTTNRGAIFEEISTSHIVGDSYYDDERIRRKDPMHRKTVLEAW
jgi:sialic acid synthase SpsE/quercetin dioxygenase-like cupin family protein